MNDNSSQYEQWLIKAGEDELSIQAILKGEGAPSTACFLAQQMAEKYLKGLLAFLNIPFRKVHDLLELETLLVDTDPNSATVHDDLTFLNRYYIETRYPGDFPEFTSEEAHEAFAAALRVKEHVIHLQSADR